MSRIICAVPQGTVLFSTTMAPSFACFAIMLVALSKMLRSAVAPAPRPYSFVGVLTQMKTMSASEIDSVTLVENVRLGALLGMLTVPRPGKSIIAALVPSRAILTILGRPFSWIGRWDELHAAHFS
jgi:fluoride ion exporter CrcB/FEX